MVAGCTAGGYRARGRRASSRLKVSSSVGQGEDEGAVDREIRGAGESLHRAHGGARHSTGTENVMLRPQSLCAPSTAARPD